MKRIGAFVLLILVVIGGFFFYQNRKARLEFRALCDVQRIRFENRTSNFTLKNNIEDIGLKASKLGVEHISADINLALPAGPLVKGKATSAEYCEFQKMLQVPGFFTVSFQVVNVTSVPAGLDQFAALVKILKTTKESLSCDRNGEQAQAVQDIELFEEQMPNHPDSFVVFEKDSLVYVADVNAYKGKTFTAQIRFPVKSGAKIAVFTVDTSSEDLRNAVVLNMNGSAKVGQKASEFESCLQTVLKNAKN